MIIAVDGMGGDHAPDATVEGVRQALEAFPDIQIRLYGDTGRIEPMIGAHERLELVHCTEKIEGDDEPVRAVRRKKDSSLVRMAQAVRDSEADAGVSAGNTGALMAAGLFVVGRLDGVDRPALAPTLPTLDGRGFVMLDMGANADAKPQHLAQYAVMGSIYAEQVRGIRNPRVGLLNIGTEENKGNDLTKEAHALIADAPVNFIGNVEARDLLSGIADVVVTDGFTGNMVLKTIEGTAQGLMSMIKDTFMSNAKGKIAGLLVKDGLKDLKTKMDYTEYGGAGLFGLKAPLIKAHGSSNANAIMNAIRQARTMAGHGVTERIGETIGRMGEHE
ncbi:phosphate:acyl-[acyl carrier protein] acyltransferase [Bhargavaea beijingensis]|uniref:Phosphate acyltransferase n=1 Tax=Bhargavaea beijingensis TaxID=426756 RepID=A0A1G7CA22_9BACL|nr:phosphate acyltransferase PlsX [Bhargavaea beijingensis]SDE36178.1 phosphate:acyl-[acyl carrier protein] acyltransferase [Bhargavaea beijingensis]